MLHYNEPEPGIKHARRPVLVLAPPSRNCRDALSVRLEDELLEANQDRIKKIKISIQADTARNGSPRRVEHFVSLVYRLCTVNLYREGIVPS